MSKPKTNLPAKPNPNPQVLQLILNPGQTNESALASSAIVGTDANAITATIFSRSTLGEIHVSDARNALENQILQVQSGNLQQLDAMLLGQATVLASIFHECARRSALNMGTHQDATERYMRLALKAQSQCRTTLETLAEIKNPRAVAFVRQANIANGPQQVNNETARADIVESMPSKLLESTNVTRLDTRTKSGTSGGYPSMEAVDRVYRAKNGRGKSGRQ